MTDRLVGYEVGERAADGGGSTSDGRHSLLRIRAGDVSGEQAVAAWIEVAGDHVQAVIDLGTAPNGDLVVVLASMPHPLPGLLASPLRLDAGEAVTVLVPLAEALAALHEQGVVHGSIGPDAVALTDAGAPVLVLPRTARTRRMLGDAGFTAAMAADAAALRALASRCLPGEVAALDALERDPGGAGVDALFGLAEPAPVRLDRSLAAPVDAWPPARLLLPVERPAGRSAGDAGDAAGRLRPAVAAFAASAGTSLRRVRRRVWIAAGASAAALLLALVLLPSRGVDASAGRPPVTASPTGAPTPTSPAPASPAAAAAPSLGPSVVVAGSTIDPVRAVRALLAARAACLASGRPACLAAVDAAGSPVDMLDRAALAAGVDAVQPSGRVVLVRRSGTTATVDVGGATVLLIPGPGGWRLRDVVAKRPPGR